MTKYFAKKYSNFFRIPESALLTYSTAQHIYDYLEDMVYRSDKPFFNNSNHKESQRMADYWKEGKVGAFATVLEIERARGLSKNAVKNALKTLFKLGLIKVGEDIEPSAPYSAKGVFYQLGNRIKDDNGKWSGEESFMSILDKQASALEGALEVQTMLISVFDKKDEALPIYNIRFEGVSKPEAKKAPKKEVKPVAAVKEEKSENTSFKKVKTKKINPYENRLGKIDNLPLADLLKDKIEEHKSSKIYCDSDALDLAVDAWVHYAGYTYAEKSINTLVENFEDYIDFTLYELMVVFESYEDAAD